MKTLSPPTEEQKKQIREKIDKLKKDLGLDKLDELDKSLKHEPVELYCLGCGKLISSNFTGGLWSYTCVCGSVVFGSERGMMYPTSLLAGFKTFKTCKVCKTEEEHINRNLELLGKNWNISALPPKIQSMKDAAIHQIIICSKNSYND